MDLSAAMHNQAQWNAENPKKNHIFETWALKIRVRVPLLFSTGMDVTALQSWHIIKQALYELFKSSHSNWYWHYLLGTKCTKMFYHKTFHVLYIVSRKAVPAL
jgi:hypothetical protein